MSGTKQTTAMFVHPTGLVQHLQRDLEGTGAVVTAPADGERETLMAMVADADILIGWGCDIEVLKAATKLKLFINPGTGISQHIENFRELNKTRSVVLANGHGNSYAVAQHTVALTMALANKVIPYHNRMVAGQGRAGGPSTTYFKCNTIGFLGYGAINRNVHRFLSGFDVKFAACRYSWDKDTGPFPTDLSQYTAGDAAGLFKESDIVITALPTTTATKGTVTMEKLELLGEKGLFVNVGRASAVVQEDIFRALKDRIIAGAAFDVWWGRNRDRAETDRNDPYQFPFHELDNVVMSPHRAADSGGDMRRWDEVIENIKRVHSGRTDYLNIVDLDLEY